MRKLIVALIVIVLRSSGRSQVNTFAALNLDQVWTGKQQIPVWNYTIAALPSSAAPFSIAIVTDSTDGTCSHGGGGAIVLCTYSGGGWVPLGGGGGGGGGGITGAAQGQPVYGTGGTAASSVATELAADTFGGSDICQKTNAAIAALPAQGGVIKWSAQTYAPCAASITINKANVTLRGAGMGNVFTTGRGGTIVQFAAGVPGIVVSTSSTAEYFTLQDVMLVSLSTAAGSDDGIFLYGNAPKLSRVGVRHFGHNGITIGNQTDLWNFTDVHTDSNFGDGFQWSATSPTCTDENAGHAMGLSSTLNGGWGFNLLCGVANTFSTTHARGNTAGAWNVNVAYNYFIDTYVESGTGSSFILGTPAGFNRIWFVGYGQPTTITDNSTGTTNSIQWDATTGDGQYTGQTALSLTGPAGNANHPFYSWVVGSNIYGTNDLLIRDRKNGVNIQAYVPATGFSFFKPVTLGTDNSIAGSLTIANGTASGHTTITSQATAGSAFALPANNGTVGYLLTTDGAGNTSWIPASSGGGITNSAPNNVVMKSDGTNAMASSLTDNGTQITTTASLNAATLSTGSSPPVGCPATGCFALSESSAGGTPTLGVDYCRADSTSHSLLCSFNGATESLFGSPPFGSIGAGTNTNPLVIGTGGSLGTSGTGTITATGLSGTPALPNGTTATTQTAGDSSNKVATDAFVAATASGPNPGVTSLIEQFCGGLGTLGNIGSLGWGLATIGSAPVVTGVNGTYPHRCILQLATATGATQGQGGVIWLSAGSGSATSWGDFGSNTNWAIRTTFALTSTVSSILRIGLISQTSAIRPLLVGLVYDTNSPLSAAAISTMTCTTTVCTVTMSATHGLLVPGQGFTMAGTTCTSRPGINTTYAYGTATGINIGTTTNFTFNSAGSSETCSPVGTVTTVPMSNFGFMTQSTTAVTGTAVDSGIAADTNWHTVVISSSTAGTIQFKVDNGSAVNISTTVPTSSLIPAIMVGTDITAQKSVQLNYWTYFETALTR